MENGPDNFFRAIEAIRRDPLLAGAPAPVAAFNDTTGFQAFVGLINAQGQIIRPSAIGKKPPSTIIPTIFEEVEEDTPSPATQTDLNVPTQVVFTGPPGTGKTLQLMREGITRANAGQKVLYVCFNKTLAAELRRDFAQKVPALSDGSIFTSHIYALVKYLLPDVNVKMDSAKDYFAFMLQQVEQVLREDPSSIEQFDVVLIDESQDLSDEAIRLLKLISRPNASWFVAYGAGQELYEPYRASPSLVEWLKTAENKRQKRNFRSGTHSFFTYQTFYEFDKPDGFDLAQAKTWVTERIGKNVKNVRATASDMLDLEFEDDFSSSARSAIEILVHEEPRTENLVKAALDGLKRDMVAAVSDSDVNALIVVKGKRSEAYSQTVTYLKSQDLPFFDLVQDANKNEIPTNTAIRVVSSLSARGLSADFVVVFDFDELPVSNRRNIAYVLLSRASRKTVVAVRKKFLTKHTEHLIEISKHIRDELRERGH
jgi:hypothetical protein